MPKTKPAKKVSREEFHADPTKVVRDAAEQVIHVVNKDGKITQSISRGWYGHTRRVKHRLDLDLMMEEELSKLRDKYCSKYLKTKNEEYRLLIEIIEKYAEEKMWNLDDYSDWEDGEIDGV